MERKMSEEGTTGMVPAAGEASAATENTDGQAEHMIPKRRFDEVNGKLKTLEAKLAEYETQQMTETQRLQAQAQAAQTQAQAAQQQLRQALAEAAIAKAAAKEGVNPELLSKLVEPEFDADGRPVNVEAAITKVLAAYPQLKPAPVTVGATNPGRTSKLTIEDVKKMPEAEINARWAEVEAVMAGK
jgi:multidrug efflux pump subunit AcrA (membrane-fusion protein)